MEKAGRGESHLGEMPTYQLLARQRIHEHKARMAEMRPDSDEYKDLARQVEGDMDMLLETHRDMMRKLEEEPLRQHSNFDLFSYLEEAFLMYSHYKNFEKLFSPLKDECRARLKAFFGDQGMPVVSFAFRQEGANHLGIHMVFRKEDFERAGGERFFRGLALKDFVNNPSMGVKFLFPHQAADLLENPAYRVSVETGAEVARGAESTRGAIMAAAADETAGNGTLH